MEKIKVLLVDDQTLFVESLRIVLETWANDISVVGVANDGKAAIELVIAKAPEVVLMDVRMPVMNGVESIKWIKEKFPEIRVLMLTTFDDDEYVMEALQLGAAGYLLKDVPPLDLITAIRSVHQGGVTISPKVASKLVARMVRPTDEKVRSIEKMEDSAVWLKGLSHREKEILYLLTQGFENKEIAQRLYIAEQTVKNYLSIIYSKMGVRDRVQASRMAAEAGLK